MCTFGDQEDSLLCLIGLKTLEIVALRTIEEILKQEKANDSIQYIVLLYKILIFIKIITKTKSFLRLCIQIFGCLIIFALTLLNFWH